MAPMMIRPYNTCCSKWVHCAVPIKTNMLLGKIWLDHKFPARRKWEAVVPAEGVCRLASLLEWRANNLSREMEGKCTNTRSIFLNRLMKPNQFVSLHAFSNPSQSKTKRGGKEKNRDWPALLPPIKPKQIPPPVKPAGCQPPLRALPRDTQRAGEAHPDACRERRVAN